jgi:hypothetical protein
LTIWSDPLSSSNWWNKRELKVSLVKSNLATTALDVRSNDFPGATDPLELATQEGAPKPTALVNGDFIEMFGTGDNSPRGPVVQDGKVLYAKAKSGVFPPTDFDPEAAKRSAKAPSASLQLEHVYGYDGRNNLSKNIFYTDNPEEIVYYAAAVGVVHNVRASSRPRMLICSRASARAWAACAGGTPCGGERRTVPDPRPCPPPPCAPIPSRASRPAHRAPGDALGGNLDKTLLYFF